MNTNRIKNIVLIVTVAILLVAVVFIVLNWPSFWKRVSFLTTGQTIDQQEEQRQTTNIDRPNRWQESILSEKELFPELFVSDDVLDIKEEYWGRYEDNHLVIPSLQVQAPIVFLDDVSEAVLQSKLKEGVGHYPNTAMPGEEGNSFIFGHSSYYWWDWSEYNSIFANLESIQEGADILVFYSGDVFVYRVKSTKIVPPTDLSVLEQGEGRELSLMTCTPLGTNINRFVVVAELVS